MLDKICVYGASWHPTVGSGQVELWRLNTWRYCEGAPGGMPRAIIGRSLSAVGSGRSRGTGDSGKFRMLRWLIRRREGIGLVWLLLLSFLSGEKAICWVIGIWIAICGRVTTVVTSVGSRCLGCPSPKVRRSRSGTHITDGISKNGTLSALVRLNGSAAGINHSKKII